METTLGGDRLGSGSKQVVDVKHYNRSTHDLSYKWRSSMASGTLVPFMSEVGLPGDSFDIELNTDVMTLPTVGPLFGSYKVQLDVFSIPIRLYQGKLHMNMLNIGMDMGKIHLPQIRMKADWKPDENGQFTDNMQINPSSIFSCLNIRGLGRGVETQEVEREFNAIPYLAYFDIYKNYYANKQEERGMIIHSTSAGQKFNITGANLITGANQWSIYGATPSVEIDNFTTVTINYVPYDTNLTEGDPIVENLQIQLNGQTLLFSEMFRDVVVDKTARTVTGAIPKQGVGIEKLVTLVSTEMPSTAKFDSTPNIVEFPLENIDKMRMEILKAIDDTTPFIIDEDSLQPYSFPLEKNGDTYAKQNSQEGLLLKTYQSDLLNNWIDTEWIDGAGGISEVAKVSTTGGSFTIDALNLANKVYNMLNRIAVSGGSYDDWLNATYEHERIKAISSPVYHGSLIKELAFEEVISTADTGTQADGQPLGTLAGRGRLTGKHKGGKMKIKVHEPSYIMGIVSLTPRLDYSQGNKWDTNLKNMDDFHKPALDQIGFQELITDQMHWADTEIDSDGDLTFASAGKQTSWINYQTNINQCRGNFAIREREMFMTLNRRYEFNPNDGIEDLTTYIDPSKFNQIFAQTSLDSQNFWVQIGCNIEARRKMSAKVIPNL